jgi:hypothetical protein
MARVLRSFKALFGALAHESSAYFVRQWRGRFEWAPIFAVLDFADVALLFPPQTLSTTYRCQCPGASVCLLVFLLQHRLTAMLPYTQPVFCKNYSRSQNELPVPSTEN